LSIQKRGYMVFERRIGLTEYLHANFSPITARTPRVLMATKLRVGALPKFEREEGTRADGEGGSGGSKELEIRRVVDGSGVVDEYA